MSKSKKHNVTGKAKAKPVQKPCKWCYDPPKTVKDVARIYESAHVLVTSKEGS